jgi:hypothetical protein
MIKLLIGVVGLVLTYSNRPPSGFGDAFMMWASGRESYLNEPTYFLLMACFGVMAFLGAVEVVKGKAGTKR